MASPNGAGNGAKKVVFNEADRTGSGPLIAISTAETNHLLGSLTALRSALAYAGTAGEQQAARVEGHVRALGEEERNLRGLLEQAGESTRNGSGPGGLYDALIRLFDAGGPPRHTEADRHRPAADSA